MRATAMEEKADLLSNLPEQILRLILSFLPLNEALRTTALSSLWRQLLAPLSLHLHHQSAITQPLAEFSSSRVFPDRLKIVVEDQNDVELFAVSAAKGAQMELCLDFSSGKEKSGPEERRSYDLTALPIHHRRATSHFASLRTLHLRSVSFGDSRLAGDVFAGCDWLESLTLEKCVKLRDVKMEAAIRLRSVMVLDCPDIESVAVTAPELRSFRYRGTILPRLELESSPELAEATLELRGIQGELECEDAIQALASLGEATTLTISSCLLQWMCTAGVIFACLELRFNRLKELHLVSSSMEKSQRDSLACFLNICPSLHTLTIQINEGLDPVQCPFPHQQFHDRHLWMDFEEVKLNTLELKHLKAFEFSGFGGKEDEVTFMELLLSKAVVLESMIVT